jgi:bacteriocin biosynthesis cyclodehydratase domain-containing protein
VRRPTPRANLQVEPLGPGSVLLRSEVEAHWLEGSAYPLILPLLDGRTADEVAAALAGELAPEAVHYALAVLAKRGLLEEHRPGVAPAHATFWQRFGADPAIAAARLEAARIGIRTIEDSGEELSDVLRSWGAQVVSGSGRETLQVVLTRDYRHPKLAELNREAITAGRPWMLINASTRAALAGPVFRPGVSACWACLDHRLQENRLTVPVVSKESPSPLRTMALQFAVIELVKWIGLAGSAVDTSILTFDPATFAIRWHAVHRRPQCPVCGNPDAATCFGQVTLESRTKVYTADGGYRTRAPEETAALLERQISPITGIMPEATRAMGNGAGPAIFSTRINGPLGSVYHREALAGRPLTAAGKGMTTAQSRAGCLAEAIERYSACFQGHEPRIAGTAAELGSDAVPLDRLLFYSEAQYRARDERNRTPEPCLPETRLDWVPSWSITLNKVRYLPAAYCFIDYPSPFCFGDSNGCAAGNTIEEAILQGFLELVERDALAIWWHNRLTRPSRDIGTFDDPALAASAANMAAQGRTLHVFDVSHDLKIPVFAAVSATLKDEAIRIGSGAHLDPRIALTRAVAEVHQCLAWPHNSNSVRPAPQLVPSPGLTWRLDSFSRPASTDLLDDVMQCVEAARARDLEVLVTNLTRPDVGLPVVRVTVPGMRHYRPRFAPGRLYEVPVEMGWLPRPLTEAELHAEPLLL